MDDCGRGREGMKEEPKEKRGRRNDGASEVGGGGATHLEEHGLLGDVGGVCVDVLVALPLLGHVDDPLAQRRRLQMHEAMNA